MTLKSTQVKALQRHEVTIAALGGRTSYSKAEGHLDNYKIPVKTQHII